MSCDDTVWLEGMHTPKREEDCLSMLGMTEFVSPQVPGFRANFKADWTHFKVVEMPTEGHEVAQEPSPALSDANATGPYMECTLRKKRVSQPFAVQRLCSTFRISPSDISYLGTKDFIGDTYQRIRLKGITAAEVAYASDAILSPLGMELFDAVPAATAFRMGKLFGNRFEVRLTDVDAPSEEVVHNAVNSLSENGFLNYYGSQRFSWFGGVKDPSYYLLKNDSISAAYQVLNFTNKRRNWCELLERPNMYPMPSQDAVRRRMILEFTKLDIRPEEVRTRRFEFEPDLDNAREEDLEASINTDPRDGFRRLMLQITMSALHQMPASSLRMYCQRFPNYLWNQALSHRVHMVGAKKVLAGDRLSPVSGVGVLHPSFTFHGTPLPEGRMGNIYRALCNRYGIPWDTNAAFFQEYLNNPSRPIVRRPLKMSYEYSPGRRELLLNFVLRSGTYASVAIRELLKSHRIPGHDQTIFTPLPDAMWSMGRRDPTFVPTIKDAYPSFVVGEGFVKEHVDENGMPPREPMALDKVREWSIANLVRNGKRHVLNMEARAAVLFEPTPVAMIPPSERMMEDYVLDHPIPLKPCHNKGTIRAQLRRRQHSRVRCPIAEFDGATRKAVGQPLRRRPGAGKRPEFSNVTGDMWNRTYSHDEGRTRARERLKNPIPKGRGRPR